jgi:hypothetical protein
VSYDTVFSGSRIWRWFQKGKKLQKVCHMTHFFSDG